jgi:hypothetical protein
MAKEPKTCVHGVTEGSDCPECKTMVIQFGLDMSKNYIFTSQKQIDYFKTRGHPRYQRIVKLIKEACLDSLIKVIDRETVEVTIHQHKERVKLSGEYMYEIMSSILIHFYHYGYVSGQRDKVKEIKTALNLD